MRIFLVLISFVSALLLCTGCTNEETDNVSVSRNESNLYSKYIEYSQKPMTSILNVALGKETPTRSEDCILGLTEDDIQKINNLDTEELTDLKTQIMEVWNLKTDDDIDTIRDQVYEQILENMEEEEFINFNNFINEYIDMPSGKNSLEYFNNNTINNQNLELYAYAALGIDNFGRIFYNCAENTRSASECKKNLATRLAITSVVGMTGLLIPGSGWIVTATVVCDALDAAARYKLCLKTRGE